MEAMFGAYLSNPMYAAAFAAAIVVFYVHVKKQLNREPKPQTSEYTKPAILVGILVYFVVHVAIHGHGEEAHVLTEPFC